MDGRRSLGQKGESLAADVYRRSGFSIVGRNVRIGRGEIDLIARRGSLIVFCEVKTRRTDAWGLPAEAVAYAKQRQIRSLAARWLAESGVHGHLRFDVVSVIFRDRDPEVTLIEAAF
jgi:putative endonuclease